MVSKLWQASRSEKIDTWKSLAKDTSLHPSRLVLDTSYISWCSGPKQLLEKVSLVYSFVS